MKDLTVQYFYRPVLYTRLKDEGKLEDIPLGEYIAQLPQGQRYWLAVPDFISEISSLEESVLLADGKLEVNQINAVVTTSSGQYTYPLEEYNPIGFIYTDIDEDPYAHLKEPVPPEELEAAIFSGIPEQQVRAWNTMYTSPEEHAETINLIMEKLEFTEENEMMLFVYANHFYKAGVLTEDNRKKYGELIDHE